MDDQLNKILELLKRDSHVISQYVELQNKLEWLGLWHLHGLTFSQLKAKWGFKKSE